MQPHERLAEAADRRRLDLGLRWSEVAAAAEISDSALRAIRRGANPPSKFTARRMEDVLRWRPGSIEAILAGGEPSPLPEWHLQGPSAEHADPPAPPTDPTRDELRAMTDDEFARYADSILGRASEVWDERRRRTG